MKKTFLYLLVSFFVSISSMANVYKDKVDSLTIKYLADTTNLQTLNDLAGANLYHNIDDVFLYTEKAIKMASLQGNTIEEAMACLYRGTAFTRLNDYDSALFFYEISENLLVNVDADKLKVQILNNKGILFHSSNKYVNAIECFKKSVILATKIDYNLGLSNAYNNLGLLYYSLEYDEKSLIYYNKAIEAAVEIKKRDIIADIWNNIGLIHERAGRYEKALTFFLKILDDTKDSRINRSYSNYCNNIGLVYYDLKEYDKAIEYFEESISVKKQYFDFQGIAASYCNLGDVYVEMSLFSKAKFYLSKALTICEDNNYIGLKMEVYKSFSSYFKVVNDYKNAVKYGDLYQQGRDTIYDAKKRDQIIQFEHKFVIDIQEKSLLENKNEIIILKHKNKLQQMIKNFSFVLIIILIIIALLVLNRFKLRNKFLREEKQRINIEIEKERVEKERLEVERKLEHEENLRLQVKMEKERLENELREKQLIEEIEAKKREITSGSLYLSHKSKVLSGLESKIGDIIDEAQSEEVKEKLLDIEKEIKINISLKEDWKSFQLHFEKVHPKFFRSLKKKFPRLTQNDLKLCAFIKLNISVKEASRLLNITPNAVKVARKRLKKKLDLSATDSLVEFVTSVD